MEARLTEFGELPHGAKVWDVGGYQGLWAADMAGDYDCAIRIFEPVPAYCKALQNDGFMVEEYGLSDRDHEQDIIIQGDRSSTHKEALYGEPKPVIKAKFRDISTVLGDTILDVLKLNVEGDEYVILPRLISTGQINQIRSLVVQFHTFIPQFGEKYLAISKTLTSTHTLTWRQAFVWEKWDLRPSS
jgi:FkbM family methyltransferase